MSEVITNEEALRIVDSLIKEREEARRNKDWEVADEIREFLSKVGIKLEDMRYGTIRIYRNKEDR